MISQGCPKGEAMHSEQGLRPASSFTYTWSHMGVTTPALLKKSQISRESTSGIRTSKKKLWECRVQLSIKNNVLKSGQENCTTLGGSVLTTSTQSNSGQMITQQGCHRELQVPCGLCSHILAFRVPLVIMDSDPMGGVPRFLSHREEQVKLDKHQQHPHRTHQVSLTDDKLSGIPSSLADGAFQVITVSPGIQVCG